MNTKSTAMAAATLALMILAAPGQIMAQAAPAGNNSGTAGGSAQLKP